MGWGFAVWGPGTVSVGARAQEPRAGPGLEPWAHAEQASAVRLLHPQRALFLPPPGTRAGGAERALSVCVWGLPGPVGWLRSGFREGRY